MSDEAVRLHIGGKEKKEGWKILNLDPTSQADFIGNASDLSQFKDSSIDQIYASHVYEHLDYNGELQKSLKEAFRVLKPEMLLQISVPDLEILSKLIVNTSRDVNKQFHIMRMIYGGHINKYDYHFVGLTFGILGSLLKQAGFREIQRVKSFGIFNDTSNLLFEGVPISLNVTAKK